jgi:anthranilate phosphoribosyltransferase
MSETRSWPDTLGSLLSRHDLTVAHSSWAMQQIMTGAVTPAQVAAFLVALRAKGETVDEIIGFRDAILERAIPLDVNPLGLDIVGTGGDGHDTVNVSTMASIVVAASGVPVIKHGNRGASSQSGSSDVLSALGVNVDLGSDEVARVLGETGITFAFASLFHPGFRLSAEVRKDLGIPTVFNILGPLCNPARPEASAVGVAQRDRIPLVAGVFQARDATALVFRGDDGLDELTTTGHSRMWEVSRGRVVEHDIEPLDFGIARASLGDLKGGGAASNARTVRSVFAGERGSVRDIVVLNAAAGLMAWQLANDPDQAQRAVVERLTENVRVAAQAIDSGAAETTLKSWISATNR